MAKHDKSDTAAMYQRDTSHGTATLLGRAAPPISVTLPVYNGERYLLRSLNSILRQEDADFELLVADNCSTDATEEICRAVSRDDTRVRYLRRTQNIGVIANHNRLVAEARGELLSYAAADDEYSPQRLGYLSNALSRAPEAVLAFSDVTEINGEGEVIGHWRNECLTDHHDRAVRLRELYTKRNLAYQFYGLIRRRALLKTMLQPPYKASDRLILAELALYGKFVHVPHELLRHRSHTEQTSEAFDARQYVRANSPGHRRCIMPNILEGLWLLRAVNRAPLLRREKIRAYLALKPWLAQNAIPMGKNLVRAGVDLLGPAQSAAVTGR